jgi:ribosomal protein S18 acetylase RimI-like enzyme
MPFSIVFNGWSHSKGKIRYGYVPWDSEIFGFAFYQLDIAANFKGLLKSLHDLLVFLADGRKEKCLIFTKLPLQKIHLIQKLTAEGFYPVETVVVPYRELKTFRSNRRFKSLRLRSVTVDDIPNLLNIARSAFLFDRYHLDHHLSNDRASYRYEYWLDNGIKAGDPVFVYEDTKDGRLLGFCHLKEVEQGIIDLSLAAIDPELKKSGLGFMMYSECLLECQHMGYTRIGTRISLNNVSVLNIYAQLGFLFRQPSVVLHYYAEHR